MPQIAKSLLRDGLPEKDGRRQLFQSDIKNAKPFKIHIIKGNNKAIAAIEDLKCILLHDFADKKNGVGGA